MPRNLYVVFSSPPEGVSWDEYNRWYDLHGRENILTRGFAGVTRYKVNRVVVGSRVAPKQFEAVGGAGGAMFDHNHMAVFEFDGAIETVRADLLNRVERGDIVLPDWFDGIEFETWNGVPIGERVEPAR